MSDDTRRGSAALRLQCFVRCTAARRRAQHLRKGRAATHAATRANDAARVLQHLHHRHAAKAQAAAAAAERRRSTPAAASSSSSGGDGDGDLRSARGRFSSNSHMQELLGYLLLCVLRLQAVGRAAACRTRLAGARRPRTASTDATLASGLPPAPVSGPHFASVVMDDSDGAHDASTVATAEKEEEQQVVVLVDVGPAPQVEAAHSASLSTSGGSAVALAAAGTAGAGAESELVPTPSLDILVASAFSAAPARYPHLEMLLLSCIAALASPGLALLCHLCGSDVDSHDSGAWTVKKSLFGWTLDALSYTTTTGASSKSTRSVPFSELPDSLKMLVHSGSREKRTTFSLLSSSSPSFPSSGLRLSSPPASYSMPHTDAEGLALLCEVSGHAAPFLRLANELCGGGGGGGGGGTVYGRAVGEPPRRVRMAPTPVTLSLLAEALGCASLPGLALLTRSKEAPCKEDDEEDEEEGNSVVPSAAAELGQQKAGTPAPCLAAWADERMETPELLALAAGAAPRETSWLNLLIRCCCAPEEDALTEARWAAAFASADVFDGINVLVAASDASLLFRGVAMLGAAAATVAAAVESSLDEAGVRAGAVQGNDALSLLGHDEHTSLLRALQDVWAWTRAAALLLAAAGDEPVPGLRALVSSEKATAAAAAAPAAVADEALSVSGRDPCEDSGRVSGSVREADVAVVPPPPSSSPSPSSPSPSTSTSTSPTSPTPPLPASAQRVTGLQPASPLVNAEADAGASGMAALQLLLGVAGDGLASLGVLTLLLRHAGAGALEAAAATKIQALQRGRMARASVVRLRLSVLATAGEADGASLGGICALRGAAGDTAVALPLLPGAQEPTTTTTTTTAAAAAAVAVAAVLGCGVSTKEQKAPQEDAGSDRLSLLLKSSHPTGLSMLRLLGCVWTRRNGVARLLSVAGDRPAYGLRALERASDTAPLPPPTQAPPLPQTAIQIVPPSPSPCLPGTRSNALAAPPAPPPTTADDDGLSLLLFAADAAAAAAAETTTSQSPPPPPLDHLRLLRRCRPPGLLLLLRCAAAAGGVSACGLRALMRLPPSPAHHPSSSSSSSTTTPASPSPPPSPARHPPPAHTAAPPPSTGARGASPPPAQAAVSGTTTPLCGCGLLLLLGLRAMRPLGGGLALLRRAWGCSALLLAVAGGGGSALSGLRLVVAAQGRCQGADRAGVCDDAALAIQRRLRGWLGRRRFARLLRSADAEERRHLRTRAACVVQAAFRACRMRRLARAACAAARCEADEAFERELEGRAACMVQAGFRGRLGRRAATALRRAVTKAASLLQRCARGLRGRLLAAAAAAAAAPASPPVPSPPKRAKPRQHARHHYGCAACASGETRPSRRGAAELLQRVGRGAVLRHRLTFPLMPKAQLQPRPPPPPQVAYLGTASPTTWAHRRRDSGRRSQLSSAASDARLRKVYGGGGAGAKHTARRSLTPLRHTVPLPPQGAPPPVGGSGRSRRRGAPQGSAAGRVLQLVDEWRNLEDRHKRLTAPSRADYSIATQKVPLRMGCYTENVTRIKTAATPSISGGHSSKVTRRHLSLPPIAEV